MLRVNVFSHQHKHPSCKQPKLFQHEIKCHHPIQHNITTACIIKPEEEKYITVWSLPWYQCSMRIQMEDFWLPTFSWLNQKSFFNSSNVTGFHWKLESSITAFIWCLCGEDWYLYVLDYGRKVSKRRRLHSWTNIS